MNQKIEKPRSEIQASECLISIENLKVIAAIVHIGSGKFRILRDDQNGKYIDRIVDASDVIHCRFNIKNSE